MGEVQASDLTWILPEIIVAGSGMLLLLWTAILRTDDRWWSVSLALGANAIAGIVMALRQPIDGGALEVFSGQLVIDGFSTFFRALFLIVGSLAVITISQRFERVPFTETVATLQFSLSGMLLMAGAVDWVTAFIALELMAVPVYVLTAMTRFRRESVEAAMKYLVLGAFATAVLIYGIAWTYGLTGTTYFPELAERIMIVGASPWMLFATGLILVAFGFKVAAVPFHAWTPDAYQGAPTPLAAFISVGPKVAAVALLARVLGLGFGFEGAATGTEPSVVPNIALAIAIIASATMVLGNLVAISQSNIKRMLGYSSIAHTGYMLVGLAAVTRVDADTGIASFDFIGLPAVLFYGFVYAFMNFGAFAVAHIVEYQTGSNSISAFRGLMQRSPLPAVAMAVFMLGLTGIPPLSGFFGKLYILQAAVESDLGWLAVLLVVTSVVSAFYYLRVIVEMFMTDPADEDPSRTVGTTAVADAHTAVVAATAGATLVLGIVGGGIFAWAQASVAAGLF